MAEKILFDFLMGIGSSSMIGFLFVVVLVYTCVLVYCVFKIKSQCKSITAMSNAMKKKVEEKEFNKEIKEMKENIEKSDKRNIEEHEKLTASSTEQLRILSFLEGKASKG